MHIQGFVQIIKKHNFQYGKSCWSGSYFNQSCFSALSLHVDDQLQDYGDILNEVSCCIGSKRNQSCFKVVIVEPVCILISSFSGNARHVIPKEGGGVTSMKCESLIWLQVYLAQLQSNHVTIHIGGTIWLVWTEWVQKLFLYFSLNQQCGNNITSKCMGGSWIKESNGGPPGPSMCGAISCWGICGSMISHVGRVGSDREAVCTASLHASLH